MRIKGEYGHGRIAHSNPEFSQRTLRYRLHDPREDWEDSRLFDQMNGQKIQVFPESVRDYFFKVFDAQITFVTDDNGRATELILH
jgi:hypothetical protein